MPIGFAQLIRTGTCVALLAACTDSSITFRRSRVQDVSNAGQAASPSVNREIFLFTGGISPDFAHEVAIRGGTLVRVLPQLRIAVTRGLSDDAASSLAAGVAQVVRDTAVQWVSPAITAHSLLEFNEDSMSIAQSQRGQAAFLSLQWNLRQVHAPEAWASFSGTPGVRVAILDSGLDPDHLDQRTLIDESASTAYVNSLAGPPAWADDYFHGTHVAGIIASNGIGIAGVSPGVRLVAVKILDASGSGEFSDMIAGITYAADVGAQVINLSLGVTLSRNAPGVSQLTVALRRALGYAHRKGVFVVASAGNEGRDLQHDSASVLLPCEPGVDLCVSATGTHDAVAAYSDYGTNAIDVAAPGGDGATDPTTWILSLCSSRSVLPILAACKGGAGYLFLAGTSMAAAHVSALAAFLDCKAGTTLAPSRLATLIEQNATDIGEPGTDPYSGHGRIDIVHTLAAY